MLRIIIALAVFIALSFVSIQVPESALALFPLFGAVLIGIFLFINPETAVLMTIVVFLVACGIIYSLDVADKLTIAAGLVSVIGTMVILYRFEVRREKKEKQYSQTINLLERQNREYDQEQKRLCQSAESLKIRTVMQEQLGSIVRELAGTLDQARIRKQMFELFRQTLPGAQVYLVSATRNLDSADEWVVRQRIPILSRDVAMDGRFMAKKLHKTSGSLIVAPIVIQGHVEDIVRIEADNKNAFDLVDLRIVELITLMTSVSLGNSRLYTLAESRAMTDGLTGLFTQNHFIEKLHHELLFARRYKMSVAIMMVDVDHFKKINDTYGHQAGDTVLRHLAERFQAAVLPIGSAARYGGEEFALLLPKTSRINAKEIASGLRASIEELEIDHEEYKGITTTVSIGISVYPEDGTQPAGLLGVADSNLYRAKVSGRNRIIG
ncbi:MAG: diguanylate cyclase [Elusimicrobia bacterium]|nr:diguanylate cyclase [Elusimicrobiota bacterium]MBD3411677.1 diguanylate cyclase [Elusimicrobiota bacterium]